MADIDYPIDLPLMLESGKSRQQANPFRANDPLAGPAFFEGFTDDQPAVFTGQFRFHTWQAHKFIAWYKSSIMNGNLWFNMKIKTESGLEEMECHFLGQPNPSSQQNSVFTYDVSIVARTLPNAVAIDNDEYYINADKCQLELAGVIDEAINWYAPEA